jgi:transposase InsO family protein
VSDNGSQFSSDEFATFMKRNGIKHFKSAPYHPVTNGLAERFIQAFKNSMRAMKDESGDINQKIANFLLADRNTPYSTTNETPPKLFLGRNLRTRLRLIKPDIQINVSRNQMNTTFQEKRTKNSRYFEDGQSVIARDYRGKGNKWTSGIIKEREGPLMYKVEIEPGTIWRRHINQLRDSEINENNIEEPEIVLPSVNTSSTTVTDITVNDSAKNSNTETSEINNPIERRYPERIRKPPRRLIVEKRFCVLNHTVF